MAEVKIEASGLTVRYGALTAVAGVDLAVHAGEVVALLGPNGAGKTTSVETLLGYRRPDAGSVRVLGLDPVGDHRRLVTRVGAMLQEGGVWPSLPARDALELFASYYGSPEDTGQLLSRLDLDGCGSTPWRRLSGGERQRLSLAIALLPKPEVLFLDEPTAGVDPVGRGVIRQVVTEASARGVAVLVCTHDLADVEAVCDRAVILQRGAVLAEGTLASLTTGGTVFESSPGIAPATLAAASGHAVTEGPPGTYRVDAVLDATESAAIAAHLGTVGAPLLALRHGATLEERYLALVGLADRPDEPAATRSRRRR